MTKHFPKIKNIILLILISVLAGYLLLVAVYAIPQRFIYKGCANSVSVFEREDLEEKLFGYPDSTVDVYTDGAMFNTALFDSDESPFIKAVACHQYGYRDKSPEQAFRAFFYEEDPDHVVTYTRYWHGFLIVLRPLLLFFNYSDIRVINQLLQVVLLCLILIAMSERGLRLQMIPVILVYFYLMPYTLSLCLQYSAVYYIGFGILFVLLCFYEKLSERERFTELFVLCGILTSYFDLLTYPAFALGIPLAGFFMLEFTKGHSLMLPQRVAATQTPAGDTALGTFIRVICLSLSFGVGYIGMWAGKWILSVFFFGTESLRETVDQIRFRSAGEAGSTYSYIDTVTNNFFMYKNTIYRILPLLYLLCIVLVIIYNIMKYKRFPVIRMSYAAAFVPVMLIPFAWMFVAKEHSYVHAFMTYRNLTVALFGLMLFLSLLVQKPDIEQKPDIKGQEQTAEKEGQD
ncbi:MAG: hypothetical protein K5886_07745 [Lachnospiraceae bacterium]|nr:hypothetical protein [Lachnospiraceae bacterium]